MFRYMSIIALAAGALTTPEMCRGEIIENALRISVRPGPSPVTHSLEWIGGPSCGFSQPDLIIHWCSVGGLHTMFPAEFGDVLAQANVGEFTPVDLSSYPFGESYIGFAARDGDIGPDPWISMGWAQLRRDDTGLSVLSSAVSLSDHIPGTASPGIVVGTLQVPEPTGNAWLALGLAWLVLRRRGGVQAVRSR